MLLVVLNDCSRNRRGHALRQVAVDYRGHEYAATETIRPFWRTFT